MKHDEANRNIFATLIVKNHFEKLDEPLLLVPSATWI
jgi:hypothetical protein